MLFVYFSREFRQWIWFRLKENSAAASKPKISKITGTSKCESPLKPDKLDYTVFIRSFCSKWLHCGSACGGATSLRRAQNELLAVCHVIRLSRVCSFSPECTGKKKISHDRWMVEPIKKRDATHEIILTTKLIISVATNNIKVTKSKTHCTMDLTAHAEKTRFVAHLECENKCESCAYQLQWEFMQNRNKQSKQQQKIIRGKSVSRCTIVSTSVARCCVQSYVLLASAVNRRPEPSVHVRK